MTAVELLAIGVVFIFGGVTGVVVLVSLASRREDRRAKLSREAPDRAALAGRYLTGLYVRRPGDHGAVLGYPGARLELLPPRRDAGSSGGRPPG